MEKSTSTGSTYTATVALGLLMAVVAGACSTSTKKRTDAASSNDVGATGHDSHSVIGHDDNHAGLPASQSSHDERVDAESPSVKDGEGAVCGPTRCASDEVCCNESCGICTEPGGFCTQMFCEPSDPGPARGVCEVDADCRLFSDYCTGCDCRPLANKDPDPICEGPGVQCLVDPCAQKVAVCAAGRCVAKSQ